MNIEYPVAIDNEYAIWRTFDNHYWPALYFVDARGRVRGNRFGEGKYDRSEQLIHAVLLTYPDSGHGSLFQYHESFTRRAAAFLRSDSPFAPY